MPVEIFLCYAHEDENELNQLVTHLGVLRRQGFLDVWYDREVSAGREWAREIDRHLNTAQIILLLVSQYFMNSDYCYLVEMKRALERHERREAVVIPILLRPVYYEKTPFAKLQALPTNAKPVTIWRNQEAAFLNIVQGIQSVAKTSNKNSIYQQNDKLKNQIPLWPFIRDKKRRSIFVEEVQSQIDALREAEQRSKSQKTKSRLQNMIETWEEFLVDNKRIPVQTSLIISGVDKTSPALIKVEVGESSTNEFLRSYASHVARLTSQISSPSKVDPNLPLTIPHDPGLSAIYDEVCI